MSQPLTDEFSLSTGCALGTFPALEAMEGIVHAVATRQGLDVLAGRDDQPAAARAMAHALGLEAVAFCKQVHGVKVHRVKCGGPAGEGDALATNEPSLGLMAFSADCPLILLMDPGGGSVGIAHASWRGTVAMVAQQLVMHQVNWFAAHPQDMIACICPSAGPCCYEVGSDVLEAAVHGIGPHAARYFQPRGDKMHLDLWAANVDQLLQVGLERENIHVAGVCTLCRNDLFPSYRKEGPAAGRFVAIIARK